MRTLNPNISQLRMLASIRNQSWMIRPDMVSEFALSALEIPEKKQEFEIEDFYTLRPPPSIDQSGIGHMSIKGALLNQAPRIYEKLGVATTYGTIIEEASALISSGAKAILLHVNSPGGTVSGNVEAAKFIESIPIPTASHCAGMACSAAYKLIAGTGAIFADESAEVGNIGTILTWQDCSEFWRQQGIEFKALTNEGADLKSTFHLEPNDEQLAFLQESINEAGSDFKNHVESNRPGISPEVFRAGWYHGERAGQLGLIDGIGSAKDAEKYLAKNLTQPNQVR